jgi:putative hydrolase of the HAD superfamily
MIRSHTGRCVVFDLDDTLYEEIDFVRSGFSAIADLVQRRFSYDCREILNERLNSRRLKGAFQAAVMAGELPAESLALMLDAYRMHQPSLRLRSGVREALTELKRQDGVVACITDGRGRTQRNKIAALELGDILRPVLISEETGHCKPDAHNYREIMRLVEANEFWYVADNPAKDFIAPNTLGWTTIGIDATNGIHPLAGARLPPEYLPQHQLSLPDVLQHLTVHTSGL